jgi:glycosyltransferase involved in cell wall biosynthesis
VHVVHLSLGFARAADATAFLDRIPVLTRLCEEMALLPGVGVTALCRFDQNADVRRNDVDYHFRVDDPGHLLAGRRTLPRSLFRLARELRPDVVHVHGLLFPIQVAELRLWLGRAPVLVVQHHGERPEGRMRPWLQRLLFRAADGFLFTAPGIADEWIRSGILDPSWPIRGVVEASTDFAPAPRAEARERTGLPGSPAILWVGRLHGKKDPMTALEGFARALAYLPGAHLSMAFGEASLLSDVQAFRGRSPLIAERVHLLGEIPHADLASHFSAADLFLTSSPAEGSNFALLEALACGTRPVASDIAAHRALTRNGAVGKLFDVGSAESCARALVAAASSISDEARTVARRHFEENLGWPAVAEQAVRAYRSLATRHESHRGGMNPTQPRVLARGRARSRSPGLSARGAIPAGVATLFVVTALLISPFARAQSRSGPDPVPGTGTRAESLERLGVIGLAGRAGGPESAGPADVGGLSVTTRLCLGGRWGITLEVWPVLVWNRAPLEGGGRKTVPAVAADGLLTFDAGPRAGRWRIRLEAGVGPSWASEPVPARGSRWNFFNEEGVRFLWRLPDGSVGSFGYRFVHVSNGRFSGEENPGLNVHALAAGWAFR